MRLGIFAKTFPGFEPGTVFQQVSAAGFRAAHYNLSCSGLDAMPDEVPDGVADAVIAACERNAVTLVGLSGTYNMAHPDPMYRDDGLRRLEIVMRTAVEMGVGLVTLCTGTRDLADQWRYHPDNREPDAWADMAGEMAKAIKLAETHGVWLGIEPELGNIVNGSVAARRLIDEMDSDRLRVVIDPANLFEVTSQDNQRKLVSQCVDLLGDRIALAHAKDRDAAGGFVAPGQGVVDFAHFLACLGGAGFDGDLVAHGLTAPEAAGVASFLNRQLEQL